MAAVELLALLHGIETFSARAAVAAGHGVRKLDLLRLETAARHPQFFLDDHLRTREGSDD